MADPRSPAFPNLNASGQGAGSPASGVTIRDWFAAHALVVAAEIVGTQAKNAQGIAKTAYQVADAMIAESQKAP